MRDGRRHYGQYCGLASALDLIGERWTLLIVRELLVGPRRYNDLLANLPGIGTNLLAARLKLLAEAGLVDHLVPADSGRTRLYRITDIGEELRPVVLGLARWGMRFLTKPETGDQVRPEWAVLAVEALIRPELASPDDEQYQFDVDGEVFHIEVAAGSARVATGPAPAPAVTAHTDAVTFVEIGAARVGPMEALVTGRLRLEGSTEAVTRCCVLLGLIPSSALSTLGAGG
ncbi:MAG: winged helix-turn-helix transcriptional regulator [Streptosporangiaceae bacterium]